MQDETQAWLQLHHLVDAQHRIAQRSQIIAAMNRFFPAAVVEIVVDNVAGLWPEAAREKILERASLDHRIVMLAEQPRYLFLVHPGLPADRLEVFSERACARFLPPPAPRPGRDVVQRLFRSRDLHAWPPL